MDEEVQDLRARLSKYEPAGSHTSNIAGMPVDASQQRDVQEERLNSVMGRLTCSNGDQSEPESEFRQANDEESSDDEQSSTSDNESSEDVETRSVSKKRGLVASVRITILHPTVVDVDISRHSG